MVTLLLKHGAEINARDRSGATPLFYAAFGANKENAELLLVKGADVHATSNSGGSALHMAVTKDNRHQWGIKNRIELVKLLLSREANVNQRDKRQTTPLHRAVAPWGWDSPEIVELLLKHGAIAQARDDIGRDALDLAYNDDGGGPQNPAIIDLLLKYYPKWIKKNRPSGRKL